MDKRTEARPGPSRRDLLRMGAATAGTAMLADFALGSTPAKAAEGGRGVTVAVCAQQMSAQSDQRSWQGMQQWLKTTGLDHKWHVTLTDAKGDPGTLVNQLQDAVTRKVDAILVMYGTLTAAHSALADIERSKIPFFSLDSGWQTPALADITSNNYVMGSMTSQYMVNELLARGKTKANIVAIIADFHHGTRKRGKVMRTVLSENDWITLQGDRVIQYAGFYETTQNTVNDWISRYGDTLDAIWCPWDEPAMAAAEVVAAHKLQNKIFVVGADGHPTALQRMHSSAYPLKATVAQSFELWGAYTGWLINEIVAKQRDPKRLVPIPSVEFPAPLIVAGENVPPSGKPTYDATDLYYIYRDRAIAGMRA